MKRLIFHKTDRLTELCSGKMSRIVSKDGDWTSELSNAELAKLGAIITKERLDKEINLEAITQEELDYDIEFDYDVNRTQKVIFLSYLSDIWETYYTVLVAGRFLKEIEYYELEVGKQFIEFNEDEAIETIKSLGGRNSFFGLKNKLRIAREYFEFYMNEFGLTQKDNFWKKYGSIKGLADLIDTEQKENNITREDLLNLFDKMTNPQQAIVPILIFEGLTFSREDKDEIRFLKKQDVKRDGVFVRAHTEGKDGQGFSHSVDRFVEMDKEIIDRLLISIQSDSIIRQNRSIGGKQGIDILPLKETEYVLRSSKGRRESGSGDVASYGGTYERLRYCYVQLQSLGFDIETSSSKYMASCGKSYYITRYMSEGLTEKEAVIKTLKRFGEWNYDPNRDHQKEVNNTTNISRINRLIRSYPIYVNK